MKSIKIVVEKHPDCYIVSVAERAFGTEMWSAANG